MVSANHASSNSALFVYKHSLTHSYMPDNIVGRALHSTLPTKINFFNNTRSVVDIGLPRKLRILFQAITQGRIYALRYELCDNLPRSTDLTERDPRRKMWDFFSPIALFASAEVSGKYQNELVPVAIQMHYTPG